MRTKPRPFSKPNLGHPLARGLGGYWLMNEGSGLILNDLSGNGNYGDVTGATWQGEGLGFSGNPDHVSMGNVLAAPLQLTIIGWVNLTSTTNETILGKGLGTVGNREYMLAIISGKIQGFVADESEGDVDTIAGDTTIDTNVWFQAAMTWDGTTLIVYKDGVADGSVGTSVNSGDIEAGTRDLRIGSNFGTQFLDGTVSTVSMHDRALSASEILQLYRKPYILFDRSHLPLWQSGGAPPATNPKGPLTHPLWGPFAGPLVA